MPTKVITAPIQKPSVVSQVVVLIVQYWIWFLVIFIGAVFVAFIIILWKRMSKHIDPFAEEYRKVKSMCGFMRQDTIRDVFLVSENTHKHLGHYLGDCITQDGYRNFLVWKFKKWYLFWIPIKLDFFGLVKEMMIIRCNLNKTWQEVVVDPETKESKVENRKLVNDLVMQDGGDIMIRGIGVERVKYFLYPILKTEDGNVSDKSMEIFEREKTPALTNVLYNLSEDFANIARELTNINPNIRFYTKLPPEKLKPM